jgi:hypothetical protein
MSFLGIGEDPRSPRNEAASNLSIADVRYGALSLRHGRSSAAENG